VTEEDAAESEQFIASIRDPSLDWMTDEERLAYIRNQHADELQRIRDSPPRTGSAPMGGQTDLGVVTVPPPPAVSDRRVHRMRLGCSRANHVQLQAKVSSVTFG